MKTRRLLPVALAIAMSVGALGAIAGLSAKGAEQVAAQGNVQGQAIANGQASASALPSGQGNANGQASANAEGIKVTVDQNAGNAATPKFKFAHVPSPVGDNAAMSANLLLVAGEVDPNSGGLGRLTDGRLPTEEDEPEANLFFDAGTWGGRFRMDLGSAIEIAQVNSYSWHPNTRGPQVYVLYASDGTDPNFNPAPKTNVDPATVGWRRIASVDTRPKQGSAGAGDVFGGQYGVSITHASGSIGKYRYLLFDCFETESDDDWGNTFYSEINVIAKKQA